MRLNIKDKMKEVGITRYELAQKMDVTYPTIDKIYKGESTSIKLSTLEGLCKYLNCQPNDILTNNPPLKDAVKFRNDTDK